MKEPLSNPPKRKEGLFCLEDSLVGGTGEADDLADGASDLFGGFDGGLDVFIGTLEEFANVGEGEVLLEEGKKARIGDSLASFPIIEKWRERRRRADATKGFARRADATKGFTTKGFARRAGATVFVRPCLLR